MNVPSCRDLEKLHPLVKMNTQAFLNYCHNEGLKVGISETLRTVERQDYLYAQGRTRPGNIVTYATGKDKTSYHQWGLAIDYFQNIKGKEYDPGFLEQVGVIAEGFGFEWGHRWVGFKDTCHLQMTFGLSIADLKEGKQIAEGLSPQYIEALEKLVNEKQILQPAIWFSEGTIRHKYIESLMIKFANK